MALALLLLGVVLAPPGSAHSRLVSSNPTDGAVLAQSPADVSLTFDEQLIDGMNTISINDETGTMVVSGPVQLTGTVMTLPLVAPLAPGTYQAAYRAVSADGHAVMGALTFTVATGASNAASEQPTGGSSSATAVASAVPVSSSQAPASSAANQSPGLPWVVWLIGAGVVLVIVALVVVAMRRAPKDPA
jgi:methionine-rich copper-binding protein CopC